MLMYTEVGISPYEVPYEQSLCIYISGCLNRCRDCHYPQLQDPSFGDPLFVNFPKILALYQKQATCVCFLGEGRNTHEEHIEFLRMVCHAKQHGLKTCLYCGRDTEPEEWMCLFDYLKLGSFQSALGGLQSNTTNQVFLQKTENGYEDITCLFRSDNPV